MIKICARNAHQCVFLGDHLSNHIVVLRHVTACRHLETSAHICMFVCMCTLCVCTNAADQHMLRCAICSIKLEVHRNVECTSHRYTYF